MATYIHRRNIQFKNKIDKSDKEKVLGVAVDPAKYFYRVIVFNFLGKEIVDPFSVDNFRGGYDELVKKIHRAEKKIKAKNTHIAIEGAGAYSDNLINHLRNEFDNVVVIPATAVASNREQKSLHGLKTDDIDCGAIGDLLIRGEFPKQVIESSLYYKLRNLTYWREKKLTLKCILKNQIQSRLDKIYPGFNSDYGDRKRLFTHSHRDNLFEGVLGANLTGQEIIQTANKDLFDILGYDKFSPWKSRVRVLKNRLEEMLLPDEMLAKVDLEILRRDVELLRQIEGQLLQVEENIVALGKKTPARYIMGNIKGISDLYAAMYVGIIGDINRYKSAAQIYSKSGLCPKTIQSGSLKSKSRGIKRAGNSLLRSILFKMASQCVVCEPVYKDYYKRLREEKNRHWLKDRIAMCRKLNNVLFALMRDRSEFRR